MKQKRKISAAALHDLLIEAAETDRRLPPALRKASPTYWPEITQEWLSYASETTQTRLSPATAKQITDYDFVHEVVMSVNSQEDRQLLWAIATSAAFRARGPMWTRVARARKTNRRSLKNVYERVLLETSARWNYS